MIGSESEYVSTFDSETLSIIQVYLFIPGATQPTILPSHQLLSFLAGKKYVSQWIFGTVLLSYLNRKGGEMGGGSGEGELEGERDGEKQEGKGVKGE